MQTICETPPGGANSANCGRTVGANGELTDVGAYTSSPSPWGTFDQGGNVWEWNEAIGGSGRGIRGGSWDAGAGFLAASVRSDDDPTVEQVNRGFRVAVRIVSARALPGRTFPA